MRTPIALFALGTLLALIAFAVPGYSEVQIPAQKLRCLDVAAKPFCNEGFSTCSKAGQSCFYCDTDANEKIKHCEPVEEQSKCTEVMGGIPSAKCGDKYKGVCTDDGFQGLYCNAVKVGDCGTLVDRC